MEILLVIAISVIVSIVSAASKKKQQQQHQQQSEQSAQAPQAPPPMQRRYLSDIQRALSFFDESDEDTVPSAHKPPAPTAVPIESSVYETPINNYTPFQQSMHSSEGESDWSREPLQQIRPSAMPNDAVPSVRSVPKAGAKARYAVPPKDIAQYARERSIGETKQKPIAAAEAADCQKSGLQLRFGQNELVQAVVYSEILKRRRRY